MICLLLLQKLIELSVVQKQQSMKTVVTVTLENEMDLVLIQKRCGRLADLLFLTMSGKATFTTAVTEICREIIEETNLGVLDLAIDYAQKKYSLVATAHYPTEFNSIEKEDGINYARKLVSSFSTISDDRISSLQLRLTLPRSAGLDEQRINFITAYFENEEPLNAYDEIKRKNTLQEEQLKEWRFINDKKSEFLSIASHELKTPLTTVKAYTQLALLSDNKECSDTVRKYLQKIEAQTNKINGLIQQLLDVSKLEAGIFYLKPDKVAFKEFIEDIVSVHKHVLPQNTLELVVKDDCEITIDKLRIEQVISNILMNASKYSAPKSTIHISAFCNDNYMQIEIRDEGIGMAAKAQQNVFEKFFREESNSIQYSGLGMGLYIASRIIEQHKGKIWLESEKDKGSTFYFTLPFDKEVQPAAKQLVV
jgi:signal transduction histidine kinase